jgi:hypothetical protein
VTQAYTGSNAWGIPLHPKPAKKPMVGKDQPIAYALDGYPIYGYQDVSLSPSSIN